jgi:hypothetical protein
LYSEKSENNSNYLEESDSNDYNSVEGEHYNLEGEEGEGSEAGSDSESQSDSAAPSDEADDDKGSLDES